MKFSRHTLGLCLQACAAAVFTQVCAAEEPAVNPAASPAWSFSGTAGPALPAGWALLTPNSNNTLGMALSAGAGLDPRHGFDIRFSYAMWGGGNPAADGISVFLFDAAKGMAGARSGGALGYCKGAGGWLGVGLDEFGNFSHPQDGCANGPGPRPATLVIRGPQSQGNPFIASAPLAFDSAALNAQARTGVSQVVLHVWPKGPGYTVAVDTRTTAAAGEWRALVDAVDFPFVSPQRLALGFAASTGAAKNVHEVGDVQVTSHFGISTAVRLTPSGVTAGQPVTLTFEFGTAAHKKPATFERSARQDLPAGVEVAPPPNMGGTCAASVRAVPGTREITIERGSVIRAGGCTISIAVIARSVGSYTVSVPAGRMLTDAGTNEAPSSANLTVTR